MTAVEAAAQRGGLFDGIVTALAYKTGNGVKRDGAKAVQYFRWPPRAVRSMRSVNMP